MQTFCGLITDGMLDYLAAIYRLSLEHSKVTTSTLAESLYVSPAAVSSMLKRLEETGHIERSTAEGIVLTEQGRLASLQSVRRHRLLEVFLVEVMGFTWDQVHSEAARLEHAISGAFETRMFELCGRPTHCPHGNPIPSEHGELVIEDLTSLPQVETGTEGVLQRVGTDDPSVLRYLSRMALLPGCRVRLLEKAPFNGPLTVHVLPEGAHGGGDHVLGRQLADHLFLRLPNNSPELASSGASIR